MGTIARMLAWNDSSMPRTVRQKDHRVSCNANWVGVFRYLGTKAPRLLCSHLIDPLCRLSGKTRLSRELRQDTAKV
jgi:hypothetical protein